MIATAPRCRLTGTRMPCRLVLLIALTVTRTALGFQVDAHPENGEQNPARPHIVVFLSDDHTWRDSSVYGSMDFPTPHMKRLAEAGLTLDRAFVASPSCAPSRAALLTSLEPARNGAEANHARPRADIRKLPSYLQELGYEVVAFGKVGHYRQTAEYGFDLAQHFGYHDDAAVSEAIQWLRNRRDPRPLCLFVGTNWPHVPWPTNTDGIDASTLQIPPHHVSTPATRQWRARYAAAVRTMDDELGTVCDAAREVLGEQTFFLHTSDHGAQWPFAKWNLYEEGIHTPMIVSWPGHISAGIRSDAMVSWLDILPTLVDVAGGTPPDDIDGRSLLPLLTGQTDTHREHIFVTHSGDGNNNVYPMRGVRSADNWMYIRNLHPGFEYRTHVTNGSSDSGYWNSWVGKSLSTSAAAARVRRYQQRPAEELYDLTADPFEQHNLVNDSRSAERLAAMRSQVTAWMDASGDTQTVFGDPVLLSRARPPNVVVVFIDDMGWSDLSCFGGKRVQTEHIDRMAAEGLRFTNFYVNSPICSPSRTALTTGQYPHRWRITSYLDNRQRNRERGVAQWLDPAAPVLARQLQNSGYVTGHFGKWHMGGQRDVSDAPLITRYGFHRSLTNFEGLGPRVLPLCDAGDGQPPRKHDLGSASLGHGEIRWEDRSQITAAFVSATLEFIDEAQAVDRPFYVNVWPDDVHSPFFPPLNQRQQTDGSKRALYDAVLDEMDRQLEPLFERIRSDVRLRDNTLILIASDNGHEDGAGSSDPLRGGKTWLFEGGVRSPLIVWGPGLLSADAVGTINETSILCALDLNRSLYAVTGAELPGNVILDGEDLSPTLLGRATSSRSAPVFWRRPPDRPGNAEQDNPDLAVRDGRLKYYVNYDGSDPQLYDLVSDVSETQNLAATHPDDVRRLHAALMEWNSDLPQDAGNQTAAAQ